MVQLGVNGTEVDISQDTLYEVIVTPFLLDHSSCLLGKHSNFLMAILGRQWGIVGSLLTGHSNILISHLTLQIHAVYTWNTKPLRFLSLTSPRAWLSDHILGQTKADIHLVLAPLKPPEPSALVSWLLLIISYGKSGLIPSLRVELFYGWLSGSLLINWVYHNKTIQKTPILWQNTVTALYQYCDWR